MSSIAKHLYLCGGLEQGGATLVSWCFWQRAEMCPAVVPAGDLLPALEPAADGRPTWLLAPLRSFRLSEMVHHYRDMGWTVHPLLVVRDLRHVWASLAARRDVHNGLTAEDPPLRLRVRRFVEDWELFWWMRWPMIRMEDLMADAQHTLRNTSARLGLPFHEVMYGWPRRLEPLEQLPLPDACFRRLRGRNLAETLMHYAREPIPETVAAADLEWLETEFQQFNVENSYPRAIQPLHIWSDLVPRTSPSYAATRRRRQEPPHDPLRWLLNRFGLSRAPAPVPTARRAA